MHVEVYAYIKKVKITFWMWSFELKLIVTRKFKIQACSSVLVDMIMYKKKSERLRILVSAECELLISLVLVSLGKKKKKF